MDDEIAEALAAWAQPLTADQRRRAADARDWVDRSFRAALAEREVRWPEASFDVSVQGSTSNDTAVAGGGDVDVAVVWCGPLLEDDATASYRALVELIDWAYSGDVGGFAFRTTEFAPVPIDVVPALRVADDGILIPDGVHGYFTAPIHNWPARHRAAIDVKDARLDGALRPVIRALKGLRDFRLDGTGFRDETLSSYLLEGLCVAAPDDLLGDDLREGAEAVLSWAIRTAADDGAASAVMTPDGRRALFGADQKWSAYETRSELITLSNVLSSGDAFGG